MDPIHSAMGRLNLGILSSLSPSLLSSPRSSSSFHASSGSLRCVESSWCVRRSTRSPRPRIPALSSLRIPAQAVLLHLPQSIVRRQDFSRISRTTLLLHPSEYASTLLVTVDATRRTGRDRFRGRSGRRTSFSTVSCHSLFGFSLDSDLVLTSSLACSRDLAATDEEPEEDENGNSNDGGKSYFLMVLTMMQRQRELITDLRLMRMTYR